MRGNELLEKMEHIDPAYIEAADTAPKRKKYGWGRRAAIAACFVLVVAIGLFSADHMHTKVPELAEWSGEYPVIEFFMDWQVCKTKQEVAQVSTNIYYGKIVDISFEIIDEITGMVDRDISSESTSRMLHTVYTIRVTNSIKGDNPPEVKICIAGGMPGYQEDVQFELMETSGLISQYHAIPFCAGQEPALALSQGETYLFCTIRGSGGFDYIINPTQFAYPANSFDAAWIAVLGSVMRS